MIFDRPNKYVYLYEAMTSSELHAFRSFESSCCCNVLYCTYSSSIFSLTIVFTALTQQNNGNWFPENTLCALQFLLWWFSFRNILNALDISKTEYLTNRIILQTQNSAATKYVRMYSCEILTTQHENIGRSVCEDRLIGRWVVWLNWVIKSTKP